MTIALHGGGVKPFSYTEDILNDLEVSFSLERMSTYLKAAGGDREKAFHLYAWNTATSAAFYGPLQAGGGARWPCSGTVSDCGRALFRVLDFVAWSRRPPRPRWPQGGLREDTLETSAP